MFKCSSLCHTSSLTVVLCLWILKRRHPRPANPPQRRRLPSSTAPAPFHPSLLVPVFTIEPKSQLLARAVTGFPAHPAGLPSRAGINLQPSCRRRFTTDASASRRRSKPSRRSIDPVRSLPLTAPFNSMPSISLAQTSHLSCRALLSQNPPPAPHDLTSSMALSLALRRAPVLSAHSQAATSLSPALADAPKSAGHLSYPPATQGAALSLALQRRIREENEIGDGCKLNTGQRKSSADKSKSARRPVNKRERLGPLTKSKPKKPNSPKSGPSPIATPELPELHRKSGESD